MVMLHGGDDVRRQAPAGQQAGANFRMVEPEDFPSVTTTGRWNSPAFKTACA